MAKLALAIIAKDEVKDIERIVKDYGKYFDEIAVAYDGDPKELEHLAIKVFPYTWKNDFADKRNYLASKIDSEYYMRIDCDDEIENPQNIKEIFDLASSKEVDVVFVKYAYGFDEDGNCISEHWRETIIKKRPDVRWNKKIHENILKDDLADFQAIKYDKIKIIHRLTEEHVIASLKRNLAMLLEEYEQDKENTDPRTIAYIGRCFIDLQQFDRAIPFLERLIELSGWQDDKYFAWLDIANCNFFMKRTDLAIASCNEALAINTGYPDAYTKLAEIYISKNDFDKALDWQLVAASKQKPDTMFVVNPTVYTLRPLINLAIIYFSKGKFDLALEYLLKAKKIAPSNKFVKENESIFVQALEDNRFVLNSIINAKYIEKKDPTLLSKFVETFPSAIKKDERIHGLISRFALPQTWSKDTIVFYCGQAWEDWADPSVITGIGGSEEAVVYLTRELAKLGWKVTVYNSCGDLAGEYNGVTYKPYWELNPRDKFNIIVSWRQNFFKHLNIIGRKRLIWLHDVPTELFGKKDVNTFNQVIVLSQFHKSLLPSFIPEDQIYVSSNGINKEDFKPSLLERNPKRIIYTSSYDRGIEHLLVEWENIRKEVPDAELHLFYGWDTWLKMEEQGGRPKEWRIAMQRLMQQDGVFEHGRIGHKQLVKELQKSAIFAYPSHFEEISCISAMKAQAAGCYPITTDFAALKETNKYGTKISGSASDENTMKLFIKELIRMLKEGVDNTPHIDEFGWDLVAKQWNEEFLPFKVNEYKDLDHYIKQYSFINEVNLTSFATGHYPLRYQKAVDFAVANENIKKSLDIGSFDGFLPYMIATETNNRVCASTLDISKNGYKHIEKLIAEEKVNVRLLPNNAFERFETDEKFDLVTCFEMLEHVIDIDVVLNKISGLLNENGTAMFTTPNKDGLYGHENDIIFNTSHLREYSKEEFSELLSKYFEVVECVEGDRKSDGLIYATCRKKQ